MTGTVDRTWTSTPVASHSESRVSTFQVLSSISRNSFPLTIIRARPGAWWSSWTNRSPPGALLRSGSFSGRMWVWTSIFSKSGAGRRWRRHHRAALLAGALLLVAEEPVEDGREILLDVVEREELFVEQGIAVVAIPLEPVFFLGEAFAFDDEADRIRHPLGRMRDTPGQQKNLA